MLININKSSIYCHNPIFYVNDYYQYIVSLLISILTNNKELKVNIMLCNDYHFNNDNTNIKININYEHTLVKKDGRGVAINTPFGNIDYDINEKYLVRIDNYDNIKNSDIIIDYTNPNILNVQSCPIYKEFSKKHIYISSSIYNTYFIKENRNITSLTTFINTEEPRRKHLLYKLQNKTHININDCFEYNKLQNVLKNTKIIINIHQTPHHNSFEELRVLPALECGVIVICETSPLKESIPYHDLIIWENYDNIINKTNEVLSN